MRRAFKISGYNYHQTKKELLELKNQDPVALIHKEKVVRNKPVKGVKAYFITKYDPRMPQPRQLISKNYHHMKDHPVLSNLFPRGNLVGGTRRQPNLSEILSPTVQNSTDDGGGDPGLDDGPGGPDVAGGAGAAGRNGGGGPAAA